MAHERFILYTKNDCPFCSTVIAALRNSAIQYEVKKINDKEDRNRLYDSLGITDPQLRTVPKMLIMAEGREILLETSDEILSFIKSYKKI